MKAQTNATFTLFLKMVTPSTDFHTLQQNQHDNYENEGKKASYLVNPSHFRSGRQEKTWMRSS